MVYLLEFTVSTAKDFHAAGLSRLLSMQGLLDITFIYFFFIAFSNVVA